MNKISPKSLLLSKWTRCQVINKQKHFIVVDVEFDENQTVILCVVEAVMDKQQYEIDWREFKDPKQWKIGWQ